VILALLLFLVQSEVVIDTTTIFAADVLALKASDPRAGVSFGYAPAPGLARRFSKYDISAKLQSAGFAIDDLTIPETVIVRRRASGLDRNQVMQAVLDAFLQHYPKANVEVTSLDTPAVQVTTGPVEIRAFLPPRFDPSGSVFVKLEMRGMNFVRTAYARTNVRVEMEQPVLKSAIPAHTSIQPSDIEFKPMAVGGIAATQFEGLLTKRSVEAGQVVTADLLYMPVYVQKGDSVTVKATAGAITVSATMRAKASGKFGETIQVEHLTGQGTTTARITGPRTLEAVK